MKILLITSSYVTGGFIGRGIASYSTEVVNCYHEIYDVSVIICNEEQCTEEIPGVKTYHVTPFDLSYMSATRLVFLIRNEIKPDIIINSNSELMSLVMPYILNNIKVISICHSLGSVETEIAGYNFQYLDKVVALSYFAKKYIITRFKISDDKVSMIPNFVADYPNSKKILERKMQNKVLKIVYTGGGNCIKNADLIAKVVRKLIKINLSFEFYWAGSSFPPMHRFSLLKEMKQLIPNDKRVIFLGNLLRSDSEKLIAEANIYLLPSRREGCPISLLEAIRVGAIPIVAEYNIANKEIVTNEVNGFIINHKDVERYVQTIRDVILAKEKFSYMYRNSYQYFQDNFTYEIWMDKMGDLLKAPLCHKKRCKEMTKSNYILSLIRLKFNKLVMRMQDFFKETLPSGMSVNIQYITKKLKISI